MSLASSRPSPRTPPSERRMDATLPVALLANALLLVGLAWFHAADDALTVSAGAVLLAGAGLWCLRQPLQQSFAALGVAGLLLLLLAAQWLVAGAAVPLLLLNVMLTLSLLPALQRAWLVLAAGALALPLPWLMQSLLGRGPLQGDGLDRGTAQLTYAAVVAAHSLLLALAARGKVVRARERFDMQFLVRAMGADGPIRLGLDAVRAESPLGERLKQVQQRMAAALRQVGAAVQGVQSASRELEVSGDELSQRTERSAAGLREAAMTLEQINLIVQTSAEAALEARAMALQAAAQAEQGGQLFEQVTARMADIDAASRSITEVIGVIEGMAFQTNLLALNAAVEAARAGDSGRGFAVVAGEVRQLALRSGAAAGEIKALIQRSNATVASGHALVAQAGRTMADIVASARKVGGAFNHLSADTSEHAGSIDAVTAAVRELDEMTRQNVTAAQTSRRIADALLRQGQLLDEVLSAFKLGGDGAPAAAPPAETPVVVVAPRRAVPTGSPPQAADAPRGRPAAAAPGDGNVTFF